jgi:hypothetical protein
MSPYVISTQKGVQEPYDIQTLALWAEAGGTYADIQRGRSEEVYSGSPTGAPGGPEGEQEVLERVEEGDSGPPEPELVPEALMDPEIFEEMEMEYDPLLRSGRYITAEMWSLRDIVGGSIPHDEALYYALENLGIDEEDDDVPLPVYNLSPSEVKALGVYGGYNQTVWDTRHFLEESGTAPIVQQYVGELKQGGSVPPIVVYSGAVVDGNHRTLAAIEAGTGLQAVKLEDLI